MIIFSPVGLMSVFATIVQKTFGFFSALCDFSKQLSFGKMVPSFTFYKVFGLKKNVLRLLWTPLGFRYCETFSEEKNLFFPKKWVFCCFQFEKKRFSSLLPIPSGSFWHCKIE